MKSSVIELKGILDSIDYKKNKCIVLLLNKDLETFTYNFITKHKHGLYSPLDYPYFKVCFNENTNFYDLYENYTIPENILHSKISIISRYVDYKFKNKNNQYISGWKINAIEIKKIL